VQKSICPYRMKAQSVRIGEAETFGLFGIFLLLSFALLGCDSTSRIFNSQAGPTRAEVSNVAIESSQLSNGDVGTVRMTVTGHRTQGKNCFGSGHIAKTDDAGFYSEFELTSFEVNDKIRLMAEITVSNTPDFVGLILEIEAEDLGKDQQDQVVLRFDIQAKLSTGLVEFSGPGVVQTAP